MPGFLALYRHEDTELAVLQIVPGCTLVGNDEGLDAVEITWNSTLVGRLKVYVVPSFDNSQLVARSPITVLGSMESNRTKLL